MGAAASGAFWRFIETRQSLELMRAVTAAISEKRHGHPDAPKGRSLILPIPWLRDK
jgi:hypothetical protein